MFIRRNVLSCALVAALVGACVGAVAQPGGRGDGPPSPEKTAKAQSLEVNSVAQSLSLPAETTAKLLEAYKAARASHATALSGLMKPGERPDFKAMQETTKAETAKFETAIKAFLTPEQTAASLTTLGTFNRRWDRMVLALDGLGLDEKPKAEALKLVMDSVAESGKAMQAISSPSDREAIRTQQEKIRQDLDKGLAKVLKAEQLEKWKAETAMRGVGIDRRGGPGAPLPVPASAKPADK